MVFEIWKFLSIEDLERIWFLEKNRLNSEIRRIRKRLIYLVRFEGGKKRDIINRLEKRKNQLTIIRDQFTRNLRKAKVKELIKDE